MNLNSGWILCLARNSLCNLRLYRRTRNGESRMKQCRLSIRSCRAFGHCTPLPLIQICLIRSIRSLIQFRSSWQVLRLVLVALLCQVYISFGYLAHDLIDLLINERSVRILELLFHHVIVIGAFLIALITNMFLGVVVLGLLMELNSIFLHSRSLLNLYRQPKDSTAFKFVALVNILTFVIFRIFISVYLLYW